MWPLHPEEFDVDSVPGQGLEDHEFGALYVKAEVVDSWMIERSQNRVERETLHLNEMPRFWTRARDCVSVKNTHLYNTMQFSLIVKKLPE